MRTLNTIAQYQKIQQKKLEQKKLKILNLLGGFYGQSDFVLISTTFFNMASRNKTPREIYPGFSNYVIWNFLFQRQFYQPGGSQQQVPHQ